MVPLLVTFLSLCASSAQGISSYDKCQLGIHKAAGKYQYCIQKGLAGAETARFLPTPYVVKCRLKYETAWTKLAILAISHCTLPRFVDNGDGTISDRMTRLQWEKKDGADGVADLGNPHDVDNGYAWATVDSSPLANGPIFTSFLSALNTSCLGGYCNWRLPTFAELETLANETACSTTPPCVDPIFVPTSVTQAYYSDTAREPQGAIRSIWALPFEGSSFWSYTTGSAAAVRGVRGGF
jgi:hypothetical protein